MRVVLVVLWCTFLSGCMGIATVPGSTHHQDGCSNGSIAVGIGDHKYKLSKTDMERVYGKPEKVVMAESGEQWYYQNGLKWRGIIVYVIAPIPLLVPVGHDFHIVNFKGELCDSEDFQLDEDWAGFQCGFLGDRHGAMALQCSNAY